MINKKLKQGLVALYDVLPGRGFGLLLQHGCMGPTWGQRLSAVLQMRQQDTVIN